MNREALLEILNNCLLYLKQVKTPKMDDDAANHKRLTGACLIPLSFWSSQLHTISMDQDDYTDRSFKESSEAASDQRGAQGNAEDH